MGSRLKDSPTHVFECFFEVVIPNSSEESAWILQKYPDDFNDQEVLKCIPQFSCPCEFTNPAIQHFSFVLTSLDSKWSFGYCRHSPEAPTLLVLLSFLPWHETFYKILNQISNLANDKESGLLEKFLKSLYECPVPDPGLNLHISYDEKEFIVYCPNHLKLASIPENRNLTEYYNAVDANNMMVVFASMLHERRILVHARKLGSLSACVQAANSLIYPMHWQHIFIPILPKHLIDYISAPMPYLIGVPSVMMTKFINNQVDLSDVVILDADHNRVSTPFNDLETLPPEIVSSLKRNLKNPNSMLGDGVSRAFMRALVKLIGGYRDSLKFNLGQKISFDADAFLVSRPPSIQPFLETMLHLQLFQQFIESRLDMLNSGIGFSDEFEYEVNLYEVHSSNNLKTQYKEWVATMKKEGGAFLKNVKNKTNPAVKYAYKSVKDKGKRAYKDIRSKIYDIQKPIPTDSRKSHSFGKTKSAPSSPTMERTNVFSSKRISYNQSSSILDPAYIPSTRTVSGIRHYKTLTADELSLTSEDLPDVEEIKKIDLDLMEDLKDVIYRRCSVSSDNLNLFRGDEEVIESISKEPLGFSDSFCPSNDLTFQTPIPPPRSRKQLKPSELQDNKVSDTSSSVDEPLIMLETLSEVDLFDPLKESDDADLLSFLAPKAATNARVMKLKNTIQNINSSTTHLNSQNLSLNSGLSAPKIAQPGLLLPRYPIPVSMNYTPNNSNLRCTKTEIKPPLPPKMKSKFFVPSNELTNVEKDLLTDYGLSNSALFQNTTSSCDTEEKRKKPDPLKSSLDQKPSPNFSYEDLQNQGTWQKFT